MPPRASKKTQDTTTDTEEQVVGAATVNEEEDAGELQVESEEPAETPVPVAKGFNGGVPICEEHDRMIPEIGKTTREIFEAFRQPFDPKLLYYKPQQVNKDKTKCQVAVYADPRAYIDRLNEVVGPENWDTKYETIVIPSRKSEGWGESRKVADIHKVQIYCTMSVTGMGSHQEIGEEYVDNPNVSTVALAMAFKRACMTFGIGRYLYDFPKNQWAKYDSTKKKVVDPPALPDFAYPSYKCFDCKNEIAWSKRRVIGGETDEYEDIPPSEVVIITKKLYGVQLCADCAKARRAATATEGAKERLQ